MRLLFLFLTLLTTNCLMAQDYQAEWEAVAEAQGRARYQTAIELLEPIIAKAKRADQIDQLAKAYWYRAAALLGLAEDGTVVAIAQLQEDLANNQNPAIRALLHLQLAKGYKGYMQERLYANSGQTALLEDDEPIAEANADDQPLAEWPSERLVRQYLHHALRAVEIADQTRLTLEQIEAIVSPGEGRQEEIPTLYDLIVYEVLEDLNDGLSILPEPVEAFRPAEVQLFQPIESFLAYNPETADTNSVAYRRLRVYQNLLEIRQEEASISDYNRPALIHAELARLSWAHLLTGADELYKQALESLLAKHQDAPSAADILLSLYDLIANNDTFWGDTGEERRMRLARDRGRFLSIVNEYPNTRAAQIAQDRVDRIDTRQLSISAEEVNLPDESVLVQLNYRNIEAVYYRLLKLDFELKDQEINYDRAAQLSKYLAMRPYRASTINLATNDDFQAHLSEFALDDLPKGMYRLLVSDNAEFKTDNDQRVSWVVFSISGMATMELEYDLDEKYYQIVDRETGSPLSDVTIAQYGSERDNETLRYKKIQDLAPDRSGRFSLPTTGEWTLTQLYRGNDTLQLMLRPSRYYDYQRPSRRVHFFTDRAIYRPGQRLFVKALVVAKNVEQMPSLVANEDVTLTLVDANGEVVAREEGRTDMYGSLSAEFTLPTGRLSGYWRVRIDGLGSQGFRVEEYKRPRFEVNIDLPETPAILGDTVNIEGQALAYSGPALADARVSYRVERQIRWWSYRYFGGGPGETQAILAQGETTTDDQGRFTIDFLAEATDQSSNRYRPYYNFRVFVDVADQTGETHAAESYVPVQQPYAQLRIDVAEEIDVADEARLQLILPPGNSDAWNLAVEIDPVTHPDPATRSRRWSIPDRPLMSKEEFKSRFPDLAYQAAGSVEDWTSAGSPIYRNRLQINADTSLSLPIESWNAGHYRVRVSYIDADGEPQSLYRHIALSNLSISALPAGTFAKMQTPAGALDVGESGQMRLVHLPRNMHGVWSWASRSRTVSLMDQQLGNSTSLPYRVEEGDRGGLFFYLQYIYRNRHYSYQYRLEVPWTNKQLDIEYETFRDRLRPGEPETWTLRIKDRAGEPAEAEVLASMYDASLDALVGHSWQLGGLYPSFYPRWPQSPAGFTNRSGTDYSHGSNRRSRVSYQLPSFDFGPLRWGYRSRYGRGQILAYSAESVQNHDLRVAGAPPPPPPPPSAASQQLRESEPGGQEDDALGLLNLFSGDTSNPEASSDLAAKTAPPVALRTNLNETAFFQPKLLTDQQGRVSIQFTSPEALTSWKFQVLAHTSDLAYALSSQELKTQKELMILPNAPRFLREGDRISFSAKVSNLSEQVLSGTAELELFDIETEERLDAQYQLVASPARFNLDPQASQALQWDITVPAGAADRGEIGYRVIARSGDYSDGEQNRLPILTNRIFLTSTESFYLRSNDRKAITLEALANAQSPSLTHMGYSLEVTSNPAWLAVKSLPYLIEYPYNCSEQLVNRYFANQISHHLVRNKPTWRTVFDQWKGDSTALLSELERNQDLKEALLEETPWLREAEDEREQRRRLGLLFDLEAVAARQAETWQDLASRQQSNGGFSWMPGGRVSPYITAYVLESLSRLIALGVLNGEEIREVLDVVESGLRYLGDHRYDAFQRWLQGREL
ncbi:MAG: alpha-2-macroglobulin family protein, partial [Bacteroidota bacterium]